MWAATSQTNDRAIDFNAAFPIIRTKQRQIIVTMDTRKWFRANDTVCSCLQHTRHPAPDLTGHSIPFWQPGPACMPFDCIPAQTNLLTSEVNISMATAQWEQMREFHSLSATWSSSFQPRDTKLTGDSALIQTMYQPSLETARRQTYAWTEEADSKPATDSLATISSSTTRLPWLSYAMWNDWNRSNPNNPADCVKYGHHHGQHEKLAQQPVRVSLKSSASSHKTHQWEQMRVFHSSFQLWPSAARPTSRVEGSSPLVWTTLYPSKQQGYRLMRGMGI